VRKEEIASRYGRALFQLALENKAQDQTLKEIGVLAQALVADEKLAEFAATPLLRSTAKEQAISKALENLKVSTLTKNFVMTLARRGRLEILRDIEVAFQNRMDEEAGVTRGTVVSAADLTAAQKSDITDVLSKIAGNKVAVTFQVDSKISGGLSAKVGGLTIDDSVQTHLKRLQYELNRRTH
jgi:F-type H+-transporting ATPase subunit delta